VGTRGLHSLRLTRELLKRRKKKIAVTADDASQAIGLDKAAYVKGLLNMIEHPQYEYENIVVLVATGEGMTRREIGRHLWAHLTPMWNMSKEGFQELYERLPGPKPPFEEAWRLTGGNPGLLRKLYTTKWDFDVVVNLFIEEKRVDRFVKSLTTVERRVLEEAVEEPDVFWHHLQEEYVRRLLDVLVEKNMVLELYTRKPYLWIDAPPPERDPELGIGRRVAWQTPLHREAVRKALQET